MITAVEITSVRVNCGTGANASAVSILATIDQCSPDKSDRGVGLQCVLPEIVVARSWCPSVRAAHVESHPCVDRLHKQCAALPKRCFGDVRRSARVDHVLLELFRVLEEQPRVRAHEIVGSDEECLTGPAHSGGLPVAVDGHQPVDLGDRELQRQHAFHSSMRSDRRDHPGRRLVRGLIVTEIGDPRRSRRCWTPSPFRRHRAGCCGGRAR